MDPKVVGWSLVSFTVPPARTAAGHDIQEHRISNRHYLGEILLNPTTTTNASVGYVTDLGYSSMKFNKYVHKISDLWILLRCIHGEVVPSLESFAVD